MSAIFLLVGSLGSTSFIYGQSIEGATFTTVTGNPITVNENATELAVSSDGNRLFTIVGSTGLRQYNMASPFDLATDTLVYAIVSVMPYTIQTTDHYHL